MEQKPEEPICPRKGLADELEKIAQHCANLPVLDDRTRDEILGYDETWLSAGQKPGGRAEAPPYNCIGFPVI
jgi:hypothetical protein